MRILIVSPYLPHSAVGHGGGSTIYHMLLAMAQRHDVRLLCFRRHGEHGLERELIEHGIQVDTVAYRSAADRGLSRVITILDRLPRVLRSAICGRPYRAERYSHRGMARRLREIVGEWKPDAVQVEYFAMAPYARQLRRERDSDRPIVALSTHEVETLVRMRRLFAAPKGWRSHWATWKLARIRRYETSACSYADRVLCVTQQDAEILRGLSGEITIHTLPLGVGIHSLPEAQTAPAEALRFLFMGSFDHPPNREAARWLVDVLLPWMRQRYPGAVLEIVGRNPESYLTTAATQAEGSLLVHGFVEDLNPLFDRATLFLAPLSSGGGIKIKVLEAMGRGLPVLTTPIGLDGIAAQPARDCASAPPGQAFLDELERLLDEREQLPEMGRRGRAFIAQQHDWPALALRLEKILS